MDPSATRDVPWDQTPPSAHYTSHAQEGVPPKTSPGLGAVPHYPHKSVSERALGPSDLDGLRVALWEDMRGMLREMTAQSAGSTTNMVQNGGFVPQTSPGLEPWNRPRGIIASSDTYPPLPQGSTAPLDCMAVILCDQIRAALNYVDQLIDGPSPQSAVATDPPPPGIRARLEQANSLLDLLNSRLSVIVNQVGII
jgi:hypothetical protein